MNRPRPPLVPALLAALSVAACTGAPTAVPEPDRVVVMTHDSFAVSDAVLAAFEQQRGVTVEVLQSGDAGSVVNQAILTRDNPLADVLFGVDNTFLSRALDADILAAHQAAGLDSVPAELRLDELFRVTPIDFGDVCLNYDRAAFDDAASTPAPTRLEDLADPAYGGMLVVENPATSSPGLAFMLATIARFGEQGDDTWLDYWVALRDNDVLVTAGWEEAYYGSFSGGSGEGDRPIVVSYATSPVAEVYFADPQPDEAPTGVVDDGCFRQVEFAGVLVGAKAPTAAAAFVDFMLGPEFQSDVPLAMFVFPASRDADLPKVFEAHAARVSAPLSIDPATIAANRERWLEEWTDAVLR